MKKRILLFVVLILLVFAVGCVEQSSLTKEELKNLPSDDPALIMSEQKALTGQGYAQLTSPQKQAFWNCWKAECQSLLKEAQQTKDYSTYRQCSLGCFDEAQTSTENVWCEDSDNIDYFTKGTVTSNIYTNGKEDYCYTFSNGKTYLMEGKCVNEKYQYQQKNCGELGENYVCEEGACAKYGKLDNAVDTLVIVNTDDFPDLTVNEIQSVFQLSEDYWLFPKTQIKFNILGVKYYSLSEKDWKEWLAEYFLQENQLYPEYIVVFKNEPINGGFQQIFELEYMLNFYGFKDKIVYCNEFKPLELEKYEEISIPAGIVDYGHKFAACGYNEDGTQIISDKGVCKGEETSCIWKNGYQMCSNSQDSFYAQNLYYFTALTIVHELLHSYADDLIYLEHFSTACAYDKLGWDSEISFDEHLNTFGTIPPFDDMVQEYASMCPYVWQQFVNSKQECSE